MTKKKTVKKTKSTKTKSDDTCKLYLRYTEERTGGEPDDPNDQWTSHEDTFIHTEVLGIFSDQSIHSRYGGEGLSYSEEFTVPKSYAKQSFLWAVGIEYSDGDTFGQTNGYISWIGLAKTEKEAAKLLSDAKKNDKKLYKPWTGYFADFECDVVKYLPVVK